MKNCYKFKSLISKYIDKEISFRERRFFESHKAGCGQCNHLYSAVTENRTAMQKLTREKVSDDFMDSLRKKILDDRNSHILASQNKGGSFRNIPFFAYGFSSVIAVVIIGFIFMKMPDNQPIPAQQLPVAAKEKIDDARKFQQKFDATPAYLKAQNLTGTQIDSAKENKAVKNLQNNVSRVNYQKK